jgi:hypothetical protein
LEEYPARSCVFLHASSRASTLVPRVRLQLTQVRSEPFGALLVEGLLGLGLRFGVPQRPEG